VPTHDHTHTKKKKEREQERCGIRGLFLLFCEKPVLFQFPLTNTLVTCLDLLLILRRQVVGVTTQPVARIYSVHLTQGPVASLKKAVVGADALLDIGFFLEALSHDNTLDESIFGTPADTLVLLLHFPLLDKEVEEEEERSGQERKKREMHVLRLRILVFCRCCVRVCVCVCIENAP
jgi:hypothetical protein